MAILETLAHVAPRELGGAVAENRRSYQAAWAILEMLERLVRNESYILFVFELHEDVLIVCDAEGTECVDCYQVKTDDTKHHWTLQQLLRPIGSPKPARGNAKKAHPPTTAQLSWGDDLSAKSSTTPAEPNSRLQAATQRSILGRLVETGLRLGVPPVRSLHLLTNKSVDVKLADGTAHPSTISVSSLEKESLHAIGEALAKELGSTPDKLDYLFLTLSQISVHSPDAHVLGMLTESVLPKLGVKSEFARAVYDSLRSDVRRCSGQEQRPASAAELEQTRAVSRAEVERLLASARVEGDAATWTGVSQLLTTWNVNPVRSAALRRAYTRVMIDRLDPAIQASTAAFEDVRRVMGDIVREGRLATFEEVTGKIASELRRASWRIAYNDDELAAVSCVVLHELK